MNEKRDSHREVHSSEVEPMREDLQALRAFSTQGIPKLHQTMTAVRSRRQRSPLPGEEWLMSTIHVVARRPWLSGSVAAILVVVALLTIPFSYDRTTGQQVTLSIGGAEPTTAQTGAIARELRAVLGAEAVQVRAGDGATVLSATVSDRSGTQTARVAQAFAKGLADRGYAASAVTTPLKERVSGTVIAYAQDRMITIETDGKSAAQLEAEIRERLADAGVPDAQVSVTDEPGGAQKVQVQVRRLGEGGSSVAQEEPLPELRLTKQGSPVGGERFDVLVRRMKEGETTTLKLEVRSGDRSVTAEVQNPDTMSDAAMATEIESQLRNAGLDARVTVTDGRIQVAPR